MSVISNGGGGVTLSRDGLHLETHAASVPLPAELIIGVRQEHTHLWRDGARLIGPVSVRVEYVETLGRESLVGVAVADGTRVVVNAEADSACSPGDIVSFGIEHGRIYLFDPKTEEVLGRL